MLQGKHIFNFFLLENRHDEISPMNYPRLSRDGCTKALDEGCLFTENNFSPSLTPEFTASLEPL